MFCSMDTLYCCCSVAQSCQTLCDPMQCSTPGFPVLQYLPEFAQTLVHWVGDGTQPCHPLSSPSPPALNLSQHQGLVQWVGSSHLVARVLELHLQPQFFQWMLRTDAEAETPILWPPDSKNWLTGKDCDAGKEWRQEEKGTPEDEMVGWHHQLDGHEFEQALGDGEEQGSLVCCSPWSRKESDTTEWLNWTELKLTLKI